MKLMRRGAIRLRPSIVMLFVLMVLPVFSAAIWVGYVSNDRMARDTANKTVERARLETIAQTEALLDPIASLVRVTASMAAEQPDFFRSDRALAPMMQVLDHSANISSVYLGFADGSYRMALRIPPGFRVQGSEPPQGTQFASRWIDRRAGAAALDRYAFFDAKRQPLGAVDAPAQYDPRVRPWFKDAVERRDLVISNPYIYATTGLPGVTVAMPIYAGGQLVGVLAIDILLDSLSQYLKTRPVSAHSTSLIVDREGYIVAHPDTQQGLKREASGGVVRVRINELADPRPALAFGLRAEKKQGNFTFMHDGDEEVALFSNFPPEFGKPWEVVIIAPLDDFVGEWKSNNRKLLLFGLVAILFQVLLIYYLSRRIAKPLELLEHQVQEVEQFSMRRHEPVHSPIREIASLAAAVDTLHSAIGAFSVFVPKELVKQLIASGQELKLGGRSRFLTVMFTDLESFSTWAETTPAQELLTRISDYFEVVTRAVNASSGTMDKFIGDGVMAFWGAPALLDEHAYLSCVAAVRIQRDMKTVNAHWQAQGRAPLNVRVGIHSDAVLVGNIGSPERVSYTVMGDGVNIAARLEGVNKEYGTRICVSHAVFREAGERLWLRRIDVVTVKGRRGEMTVYELLGIRGAEPELEASPEVQELCAMTDHAYEAYEARAWVEAAERYQAIVDKFPGDVLGQKMWERCAQMARNRIVQAE